MLNYLLIIEKSDGNYSAFVPDLPGCITVGETIDEVIEHAREAITLYLETLLDQSKGIPSPNSLQHHLTQGVFNADALSPEYCIVSVQVDESRVAA